MGKAAESWLNMLLTYAIQAEIDVRLGRCPIDVLHNMQVFIEDEIERGKATLTKRVTELRGNLEDLVKKAREE